MWYGRLSIACLQSLVQPALTVTHLELVWTAQLAGQRDCWHCHFRNQCGQVSPSLAAALSTTSWQIYILEGISKAADVTNMHQWSITPASIALCDQCAVCVCHVRRRDKRFWWIMASLRVPPLERVTLVSSSFLATIYSPLPLLLSGWVF